MVYSRLLVLSLLLCLLVVGAFAQQPAAIQGVWHLVSQKYDGKATTLTHMIKTITKGRWSWIQQDKEQMLAQLAKQTHEDSLKAYADNLGAGYGTYTLEGDTYTETIEYMSYPYYIGRSFPFKVKIDGDHLYQSGKLPYTDTDGKEKEFLLEEEYQRLE